MLQFSNADMDAALAPGQERTLRPLVQFDWLKNESFAGAGTQINADHIVALNCVDQGDSALPDEVIGRATASSTTLTVKFKGETADGTPFWKLFSPWNLDGPYRGLDLSGAAVKYDVYTATSPTATETRRFTGWVARVDVDRVSGVVTAVCQNNLHLVGKTVSFPRWARQTDVYGLYGLKHVDRWDIPNEDRMENTPLQASYLFQSIMRQCNALPGPNMRGNGCWFSSGYGGLIPERGALMAGDRGGAYMNQGISAYIYPQNWGSPNLNRDVLSWSELGFPSPYHQADTPSGFNSDIFDTYSQSAALVRIFPTGGQPRYLNGALWVRVPSGDSGAFTRMSVMIDELWGSTLEPDVAGVVLNVGASNTTLRVQSTGVSAPFKQLTVSTPTTKDTLIYVSFEVDFQVPGNSKVWYNNVQQSGSFTGALATYPALDPGTSSARSKVRVWNRHSGYLNAELWQDTVASGSTRVPTWSNTAYGRKDFAIINGGYPGAQNARSDVKTNAGWAVGADTMPAVTHIPVRENVDAWELLKELCAAFQMTMFIDAYGGLRIIPQGVMALLEQRLTEPRKTLDGDSLQGVKLTSTFDQVRDKIVWTGSPCSAVDGVAYSASQARQYRIPGGGATTYFRVASPDNTINVREYQYAIYTGGLGGGGWTWDQPMDSWGGRGYVATEEDGDAGTATAVWPVHGYMYDIGLSQQYFDLQFNSTHSQKTYLALASSASPGNGSIGSPALLVPGLVKLFDQPLTYSVGSGNRLLEIPQSDFHSAPWTHTGTMTALLNRTNSPVPRADDLQLPGDPRRELYDLITLRDPDGGFGYVIAQVTGRSDSWTSSSGYTQRLQIRLLTMPGAWLLEVDGYTELDQSAILA